MALSFDEFNAVIEKAGSSFMEEVRKALTITAFQAERKAKINATSYPKVRTGRLRSSIAGRIITNTGIIAVELRAGNSDRGGLVNYAEFVEFGTRNMTPRLFMKRAIDEEAPNLQSRLDKVLKNAFKR